jgi:iron complex outermembrane receptor protein
MVAVLLLALALGLSGAASAQTDADELFSDEDLESLEDDRLFEDPIVPVGEEPAEATEPPETERGEEGSASPSPDANSPRTDEASDLEPIQPPSAASSGIEEIVVQGQTGQGIEIDASMSATSFDADDLASMGVQDVGDLAQFTPNLEIRTVGATGGTFFIRGVGLNDFTANAASSVAVYQDDVALNLPAIALGQVFDTETIDVLRGPQGSGAGRNASAGAIKVYSRKPTGDFGATLRADYGRYDFFDLEGAVELPLVEDLFSTRLAFRLSQRDAFVRNGCGNAPPIGLERVTNPARITQSRICGETGVTPIPNPDFPAGPPVYRISSLSAGLPEKVNDADSWSARAHFRFLPPDTDIDWLVNVHGGRIDQLAALGQAIGTAGSIVRPGSTVDGRFGGRTADYRQPEIIAEEEAIIERLGGNAPGLDPLERQAIRADAQEKLQKKLARRLDKNPYRGDYNKVGKERQDSVGGFLRGDWEGSAVSLTTISAVEYYDRSRNVDADYTPNVVFESKVEDEAWQFTQELKLGGELTDTPLEWDAGAYYLMEELDFKDTINATAPLIPLDRVYEQNTWSFGVHGGFRWDFLDDFRLEGGVRYNWERKAFDIDLFRGSATNNICVPLGTRPPPPCDVRKTWQAPTGSLTLTYHLASDISAFWKYSRGWKTGQLSPGGASGAAFTVADPETIDSFEVGLNAEFFDGRVTLRAALFHYSYDDYQVFLSQNDINSPPQRVVVNASDARIYGGELDARIEPLEGLVFTSRLGWLESEFLDFAQQVTRLIPTPEPPPPVVSVSNSFTGNRLPNTPRFKWSGTLEYTLDLGRWGMVLPRYDAVFTDDNFFDPSEGRGAPNDDNVLFLPDFAIGQRSYWLHNVRLTYRTPEGDIEVAGWIRNVTDEVYKTLAFDASQAADLVGNFVGDPRTYGVSISFTW